MSTLTSPDRTPAPTRTPHGRPLRVLILSADMGGGHQATAAALREAVLRLWPGSMIEQLDTLDVMGHGVGKAFRAIYVTNVEHTPWLYELFYTELWRHRWFAHASKRVTGSWCGRRLSASLDAFRPDMVLTTYPLGSAGLAWLRRHRGLSTPTAAWVSDFAPHPFWVYPEIDTTFVMHLAARAPALVAEPKATVVACAPPVRQEFAPGERRLERGRLGLEPDAFVVLLSCGAYAFGNTRSIVESLLAAGPHVQVVVACGTNTGLRDALARLGLPGSRLLPMGWTDRMAHLVRAADLVVGNAGGATALEAIASGRALVMVNPIAAHGAANVNLTTVAGLADACSRPEELTAYVRNCVRNRTPVRQHEQVAREHRQHDSLDASLLRFVCAHLSSPGASHERGEVGASDLGGAGNHPGP